MDPCKTFNLTHPGVVKRVNETSTKSLFVVSIDIFHVNLVRLNWTEMANHQNDFASPEGFCVETQSSDSSMNPF